MEQYEVRIFPTVQQDLLDVIDYLNTLSQDTALKYYDRLISEIASLSTMPERCSRPRDLALAAKGYRYLVVGNYLVFYVVAGNVVQIRRILYARRDYKQALLGIKSSSGPAWTTAEKAAMWQSYNTQFSARKNPYDRKVGQKVKAEIKAASEKEDEPEKKETNQASTGMATWSTGNPELDRAMGLR